MNKYVQQILIAANERREMTKCCLHDYFKRFGAIQRYGRGDFEIEEPQLQSVDIESLSIDDLQDLSSAIGEYEYSIMEWSRVCKHYFGKDNYKHSMRFDDLVCRINNLIETRRNNNDMKLINTEFQDNHGVVVSGGNNKIEVTFEDGKMKLHMEKDDTNEVQEINDPDWAMKMVKADIQDLRDSGETGERLLMPYVAAYVLKLLPSMERKEWVKEFGKMDSNTYTKRVSPYTKPGMTVSGKKFSEADLGYWKTRYETEKILRLQSPVCNLKKEE